MDGMADFYGVGPGMYSLFFIVLGIWGLFWVVSQMLKKVGIQKPAQVATKENFGLVWILIVAAIVVSFVAIGPIFLLIRGFVTGDWGTSDSSSGIVFLLIIAVLIYIGTRGRKTRGRSESPNQEKSQKFNESIESMDAMEQYDLGMRYYYGQGVEYSTESALKLWRLAASKGYIQAQYQLGYILYNGHHVAKDYAEAYKWMLLVAEHNHPEAQLYLGMMYDFGRGVGKDDSEAIKWYRLSAEQGEVRAQINIGLKFYRGEGVQRNLVISYAWLNLAKAYIDKDRLDEVESQMTPEQIAEAQRMARELVKPKK